MEICFHQCLNNINIFHVFIRRWPQNIQDVDNLEQRVIYIQCHNVHHKFYIFVMKPCQDLDFSESALAVGLMFKGSDLLYRHLSSSWIVGIYSRATENTQYNTESKASYTLTYQTIPYAPSPMYVSPE